VHCAAAEPADVHNNDVLCTTTMCCAQMPERKPQPNGVLDPRLGISSKMAICTTCGQKLVDCTGHFGASPSHSRWCRKSQQPLPAASRSADSSRLHAGLQTWWRAVPGG
jgi:hypothetical protein